MPTDLDDRIARALGRLADTVDDAAPVDVPDVEWSAAPEPARRRALVGWLAVAAALVVVLVAVGLWRRDERGVVDLPRVTTSLPASPVDPWIGWPTGDGYGEVAPLADASIYYLPDPMPAGWHVSQLLFTELETSSPPGGPPLDAVPPIGEGTQRQYNAFLFRDDGTGFAMLNVVETPNAADDREPVPVSADGSPGDGYGAAGLVETATWSWAQDGRNMGLVVVGDQAQGQELVDAMAPVGGDVLEAAVVDGQRSARAMPVIESLEVSGVTLTTRGPGGRVVVVCADAVVSTCSFVATYDGLPDIATGWVGTSAGVLRYGWVPSELASDVDPATDVFPAAGGAFIASQTGELTFMSSGSAGDYVFAQLGMPRLVERNADFETVPVTDATEPASTVPRSTAPGEGSA